MAKIIVGAIKNTLLIFFTVATVTAQTHSPKEKSTQAQSEPLLIATAANFRQPLQKLIHFMASSQSHDKEIRVTSGSTGAIYQKILKGAPYHLFFAADEKHPRLLERAKKIVPGSRKTYAEGKLVLWSSPNIQGGLSKRLGQCKKLVFAHPQLAPYGKAAQRVLDLSLPTEAYPRLIRANNVGQAMQMIHTRNVDCGFVAWSQVLTRAYDEKSYVKIPQDKYPAIRQQMVIIKHRQDNPSAKAFAEFVMSKVGQALIAKAGYQSRSK
ncbi:MAG: molybdate ABC transporter substrate-binding protein [Pseudomonadota bacterium]